MLQASKDRRPLTSRDPAEVRMPGLAVALHAIGAMLFIAGALVGYVFAARLLGTADMLAMPDARITALADMIGDGPGLRRHLVVQAWTIAVAAVLSGLILWLLCATLASALSRLQRIEAALQRRPG